ncbi:hypothetical protein [Bradyrhizobium canariense]|uniref:hypothetical protein n=1 Tax=Bradyrhizobium canariense TaxID=255045 RepID=UPI002010D157|nr:hypothetical protein [Bradyrhizobium canariense]
MIWPQFATLLLTYPTFLWIVHAPGALSLLVGFGVLSVKAARSQAGDLRFACNYWRMRRLKDQGQASGRMNR